MTPDERTSPDIIKESRKKRIARGSGRPVKDVSDILKKFKMMRDMMKNMGRSGLLSKISGGLSNIPGMGGSPDLSNIMGGGLPSNSGSFPKPLSVTQKKKVKSKRKQAKKARKKSRKK